MSEKDNKITINKEFQEAISKLDEFRLVIFSLHDEINASMRVVPELKLNSIIRKVVEDFAQLNSIQAQLSTLKLPINSPIFDIVKEYSLSISKIANPPQLSSLAKQVVNISRLQEEQLEPIKSVIASINASQLAYQAEFTKIAELTLMAQRSLSEISFQDIGKAFRLAETVRDSFISVQHIFSESFFKLYKPLENTEKQFDSLPLKILLLPPVEFYTNTRVLQLITKPKFKAYPEEETFTADLIVKTTDTVSGQLRSQDPALIKLWQGANKSLGSGNPDAVRHFSTSMRELLTQIIHKLAPDDEVRLWSTSPKYYSNNKPTRRARLLYICRKVNYEPFNDFLDKDIKSVLACFDMLQAGTHGIESPFNSLQLEAIKLRVESTIKFLIDIANKTSNV